MGSHIKAQENSCNRNKQHKQDSDERQSEMDGTESEQMYQHADPWRGITPSSLYEASKALNPDLAGTLEERRGTGSSLLRDVGDPQPHVSPGPAVCLF